MSNISSNVSLHNFLNKGMQNVDSMSTKLDQKMQEITAEGKEMKAEDLLLLQFEMGQYQAYMSALNTTIQSIQNQVKEMANSIR